MTEPENSNHLDQQPHPTKNKARASNDRLMSLFAVALSLMALLVSVIEVSFLRDEVRAEAWPYLQIDSIYNSEGFALKITNKGVGPARIRNMGLFLSGQPLTDLDQAIIDTIGQDKAFSYDLYQVRNPAPGVMSAGESVIVFSVPWTDNTRLLLRDWGTKISGRACFCSIYEDCWMANIGSGEPEKIDHCPVELS